MKLNDAVWGALLILFSAAILVHVQGFPTIPGQKVGPALFPGLLAAGLAVCAVILIGKGIAARAAGHEHLTHLAGGLQAWKAAGLPVIRIDPQTGRVVDDGRR